MDVNMRRKWRGYLGERLAERYLTEQGFSLIARNFTIRGGEIDLIFQHNSRLVFVEVKTRTTKGYGEGIESLTIRKKQFLRRAMHVFLSQTDHTLFFSDVSWNVVDILLDAKEEKILSLTHYKNIHL